MALSKLIMIILKFFLPFLNIFHDFFQNLLYYVGLLLSFMKLKSLQTFLTKNFLLCYDQRLAQNWCVNCDFPIYINCFLLIAHCSILPPSLLNFPLIISPPSTFRCQASSGNLSLHDHHNNTNLQTITKNYSSHTSNLPCPVSLRCEAGYKSAPWFFFSRFMNFK